MSKIEEKYDRRKLIEGRNYGFGFAFLDKINDEDFETMHAFTACKDFLNDFVYVENTEDKFKKVYGFHHKKTGKFNNKRYFYLGVKAIDFKNDSKWKKLNELKKALNDNTDTLIKSINMLEDYMRFTMSRTSLEAVIDDTIVLKVPIKWFNNSVLISLYTLYIRCYFNVPKENFDLTFKEFINKQETPFLDADKYLLNSIKKLIESNRFKRKIYEYNWENTDIHNFGINAMVNKLKNERDKKNNKKKAKMVC